MRHEHDVLAEVRGLEASETLERASIHIARGLDARGGLQGRRNRGWGIKGVARVALPHGRPCGGGLEVQVAHLARIEQTAELGAELREEHAEILAQDERGLERALEVGGVQPRGGAVVLVLDDLRGEVHLLRAGAGEAVGGVVLERGIREEHAAGVEGGLAVPDEKVAVV